MATSKGKSFLTIFILILNFNAIAGLLLSYLAPHVSPEKTWIIAFFGLAYPVLLLINLFFVLLWIFSWKKYFIISLLAIAGGYHFLASTFRFYSKNETAPAGSVKILTYNVHSLYGVSKEKNGQGIHGEVVDFIASEKPDILCIQEFLARDRDSLAILPKFGGAIGLPHYVYKNYFPIKDGRKINAIATFSRFELLSTGSLRLNNMNVFAIFCDMVMGKDTVRLYNVHLKSISLGADDLSFYSNITDPEAIKPDKTVPLKEGSLKIFYKLKKAFVIRARQVDALTAHIRQSQYPVIIAGDFNDTPYSYTYHQLKSGLEDSFSKAGSGLLGNTYAGKFPSFRIDYILHNKIFTAFTYKKYDIDVSDHYPVSVYLKAAEK